MEDSTKRPYQRARTAAKSANGDRDSADAPSEPGTPTAVAAPEGGRRRSAALAGLLFLGVLYTLYFARALVVPIVLAALLDFLLKPLVGALRRVGLPEAAGAAIVVLGSLGSVAVAAYQLADPAREWAASAPATLRQATDRLRPVRRPLEGLNRTAQQVQQVTRETNDTTAREVAVEGPPLSAKLLGGAQAFITSALEVMDTAISTYPVAIFLAVLVALGCAGSLSRRAAARDGQDLLRSSRAPCAGRGILGQVIPTRRSIMRSTLSAPRREDTGAESESRVGRAAIAG